MVNKLTKKAELSSLMHFDAISCSKADSSISHALALFWSVTLPLTVISVHEFRIHSLTGLALNFDQCSICLSENIFLFLQDFHPLLYEEYADKLAQANNNNIHVGSLSKQHEKTKMADFTVYSSDLRSLNFNHFLGKHAHLCLGCNLQQPLSLFGNF